MKINVSVSYTLNPTEHFVLNSARVHVDYDQVMPQHDGDEGEQGVVHKYSWLLVFLEPGERVWFHEAVVDEAISPGSHHRRNGVPSQLLGIQRLSSDRVVLKNNNDMFESISFKLRSLKF